MKRKIFLIILVGIITTGLLLTILTAILFEPWIAKKIDAELNGGDRNYLVKIEKVNISILKSGLELYGITINSKPADEGDRDLNTEIESIKFKGINLAKAIFRHDIHISAVTISNSNIKGDIPFSGKALPPIVSPLKIGIGRILFDKLNIELRSPSTARSFSVKDGVFKVYDFLVEKQDTLLPGTINLFDLKAKELISVPAGNMYSYIVRGINYSATSNSLAIDSLYIQPTFADYDFTSRYKFQTNRIEAIFTKLYVNDFYLDGHEKSWNLISPYIEIGKMDMMIFRDRRKENNHLNKPMLQDILYGLPGTLRIDSIGLLNGNITFTVHGRGANEPGSISFNEINARIFKITNDTIYKTEIAFLELTADALLMGKGKMSIFLKGRIYDSYNTYSLDGNLSDLEAKELNPILEKIAFFYATTGKIDAMNFSYTADKIKARGELILLYHKLDITFKNKRTGKTTAFKERFISFIANRRIINSNPVAGERVRVGIIDYKRDPERYIFHYFFNSILSGITSSLTDKQRKRDN